MNCKPACENRSCYLCDSKCLIEPNEKYKLFERVFKGSLRKSKEVLGRGVKQFFWKLRDYYLLLLTQLYRNSKRNSFEDNCQLKYKIT